MSRTITRKSDKIGERLHTRWWLSYPVCRSWMRGLYPSLTDEEIILKLKNKYHASCRRGLRNTPRDIRKMMNKNVKIKNKKELFKTLKYDYEIFNEIPLKRNANFYYF